MVGLDLAEYIGSEGRSLIINHLVVRSAKKDQIFIGVELLQWKRCIVPGAGQNW
jgi:hypothetical protein